MKNTIKRLFVAGLIWGLMVAAVGLGFISLIVGCFLINVLEDISKFKVIRTGPNKIPFLYRWSIYIPKKGSVKIHWIVNDDGDLPHTHPWHYKSFLILPYKEDTFNKVGCYYKYKEYNMFSVASGNCEDAHTIKLYKWRGYKIPALTVGWYSEKKQLCSLCKDLGYCRTTGKPV